MNGLVVLISVVVALSLLGLIWWWVVQPHGHRELTARDIPLPLFTTRTPGRGVRISRPNLGRVVTPEAESESPPAAPQSATDNGSAPRPVRRPPASAAPPPPREPISARPERHDDAPVHAEALEQLGPSGNGGSTPSGRNGRVPPAVTPTRTFDTVSVVDGAQRAHHSRVSSDGDGVERWAPPSSPPSPAGTIQFLPGRLEVLHGRAMAGQEVRFVRPDRPDERAVVTFGRGDGAPYRHVQLKVPTVSRLHARMSLEPGSGTWKLENLSTTNPVSVNGVDLVEGGPPVALCDGDRVEMGEIIFTFRAR